MGNNKYTYTKVQQMRKTAGYFEDRVNSGDPNYTNLPLWPFVSTVKGLVNDSYDSGFESGVERGNITGWAEGKNFARDVIGVGAGVGGTLGALTGAGAGSLFIKPNMSAVKRLAIILAGAGIGGAAGAGIGGAIGGSILY